MKRRPLSHANVRTSSASSTYLKGAGVLSSSILKKMTLDCAAYQSVSAVVSHQSQWPKDTCATYGRAA